MTLHLLPTSRRGFIQASAAVAWTALSVRDAAAAETDPNYWAMLADTHIAGDPTTVARGVNMLENLNRIDDEVLAESPRPVGVIINGDCAYLKGLEADYATFRGPVQRLVDAGLPVHMTMGNHDDRTPFYSALANQKPDAQLVSGKHVTVLKGQNANLFPVDSLQIVDNVTGEIGKAQLGWLKASLQEHSDRPAVIVGHHNPQTLPEGSTARVTGLADTREFIDLMHSQPHVQSYVFGHTHDWKVTKTSGRVHLVNQPPCAYLFNAASPNGWVRLSLGDDEQTFELVALDKDHPQHGEQHRIEPRFAAAK